MISVWESKPKGVIGQDRFSEITMIALLHPISCNVHGEKNGDFSVTMEISANDQYCIEERILEVPTPKHDKQWFRIYDVEKNLDVKVVSARHIFYDLMDNFIEDTRPTNCTGAKAIECLFSGLQYQYEPAEWNSFTGTSDITTINTAYWEMMNPVEALIGDQDNSFINRWGGVLDRNNLTFTINLENWKAKDFFVVTYGKNLEEAGLHLNLSEVATRIMPTGLKADGQTLLKLPEKYVDSPRIDAYVYPKVRRIHYSDIRVGENEDEYATEAEAIQALRARAAAEFDAGIDLPIIEGTLSILDLSKTREYEDVKTLETITPYTPFRIYIGGGDFVEADMLAYDYDAITKEYTSITVGKEKFYVGETMQKKINRLEEKLYTIDMLLKK